MRLCGHLRALIEKLRGKISALRPNERVQIRIDSELLEILRVLKWLEDLAMQLRLQIDFTLHTILKSHQHNEVSDVTCFETDLPTASP